MKIKTPLRMLAETRRRLELNKFVNRQLLLSLRRTRIFKLSRTKYALVGIDFSSLMWLERSPTAVSRYLILHVPIVQDLWSSARPDVFWYLRAANSLKISDKDTFKYAKFLFYQDWFSGNSKNYRASSRSPMPSLTLLEPGILNQGPPAKKMIDSACESGIVPRLVELSSHIDFDVQVRLLNEFYYVFKERTDLTQSVSSSKQCWPFIYWLVLIYLKSAI